MQAQIAALQVKQEAGRRRSRPRLQSLRNNWEQSIEDQLKAQIAVLDSKQHASSDAQALALEQQEANIRDKWRHVPEEHTSVHEVHKEARRSAVEVWTRRSSPKSQPRIRIIIEH